MRIDFRSACRYDAQQFTHQDKGPLRLPLRKVGWIADLQGPAAGKNADDGGNQHDSGQQSRLHNEFEGDQPACKDDVKIPASFKADKEDQANTYEIQVRELSDSSPD